MFDTIIALLDDPAFQTQVKYSSKKYQANQMILHQGEIHENLYLIKSGKVRIIIHSLIETIAEKKTLVHPGICDLSAGEIFGEFALFDNEPASADVITITASELIEVNIASFREFLDANQKIGYKIIQLFLKTLIKRLRHADKNIIGLFLWGMKAYKINQSLD